MQFGLALPVERTDGTDPAEAWAAIERQARLAEAGGLDSLWVSEHHFTDRPYFDNFQTLSALAAATDAVTLGTAVCLAPLYNPVRLAERVANLDVQSGGRVTLGLGLGFRRAEFDVLGIDRSRRVPRLLETLDVLEACWREDGVSHEGEEFAFDGVSVNPKPIQAGGPDVWLGGGTEASVRRAAARADAWLPGASYVEDDLAELYPVYEGALTDEPTARPLWREVFVARDRETAVERAKGPLVEKYDAYADAGLDASDSRQGGVDERFEAYREGRFVVGTPAEVIEGIEACRERFGVDHFLFRTQWPGLADEAAESSLGLFCDEVLPAF